MRHRCGNERGMGSFGLIGVLVASLIVVYLAVQMIPKYGIGTGGTRQEKAKTPIGRAKGVECTSYLTQCRQAVQMYMTQGGNEKPPASLRDLKTQGVADEMMYCPEGGKQYPYGYDPRTGKVWCTFPGHEKL